MRRGFLIAVLGFVAFVTSFGAHVVAVNLPVYAKQVGVGLTVIGVLTAVYDFAEIFAKPVFGWIADRRGIKTHACQFKLSAYALPQMGVHGAIAVVDGVDPPGDMFLLQSVSPCGSIAINSGSLGVASSDFKRRNRKL